MNFKKSFSAAVMALCLLAVASIGTTAFAASPDDNTAAANIQQAETQSVPTENTVDELSNEVDDEKDNDTEIDGVDVQKQADLAAQAKIAEADAIAIAESVNSGYTFSIDELDSENGVIVYDLKGSSADGNILEIKVNAIDGTIMPEADDEHED